MQRILIYTFISILSFGLLSSCFEEQFITSPDAQLEFSLDTLRFDTVFTELGSATRAFRVYNRNDLSVVISKISIEDQAASFTFNIDGTQGPVAENVEIRGNDSIWVFVEVVIDPDQPLSSSPFVIENLLTFLTNGNEQTVLLEAWGQNANYIPSRFSGNTVSILSCDLMSVTWDDPKPYVIYGTLLIDSCTLVWPAGARIYVHGGIADNTLGVFNDGIIFTLPKGRIRSVGTVDNPVIVRDDRTEPDYSGLWGGIRFGPRSGPHLMEHTTVRNATTAVAVDSSATLTLDAVQFYGTAGSGLFARHANVTAVNSLFYDNAGAGVALTYGGDYVLDYCTIASFGNDGEGLAMTNFFCSDPLCSQGVRVHLLTARVRNSIIVGSASDEILLSDATREQPQQLFDVQFENCIVRVNDLLDVDAYPMFFETICGDCIEWGFADTLFIDQSLFDFHLDTLSIAEQMAVPLAQTLIDLDGVMRDLDAPDIGCFERVN